MSVLRFFINQFKSKSQALKQAFDKSQPVNTDGTVTPAPPKEFANLRELAAYRAQEAGITDPNEFAMFMAQHDHESLGFTRLEESFNYKPERLLAVFARYVKDIDDAKSLISQGKAAIANRVYGGRMGNVNVGDGYKYRGRGLNMLTGADNYALYSRISGLDLINNPDQLLVAEHAVQVAISYWQYTKGLVQYARQGDVQRVSAIFNTGSANTPANKINGLQERIALYKRYKLIN